VASNALTHYQNKIKSKDSVIRKNHEDVIQLPMDHNRVPPLHVHPTGI